MKRRIHRKQAREEYEVCHQVDPESEERRRIFFHFISHVVHMLRLVARR